MTKIIKKSSIIFKVKDDLELFNMVRKIDKDGIEIISKEPIDLKTPVTLLSQKRDDSMALEGEVSNCRKNSDDYHINIKFTKLNPLKKIMRDDLLLGYLLKEHSLKHSVNWS